MTRVTLDFPGTGRQHFGPPRRIIEAHTLAEVLPAIRAVEAETAAGAWAAGLIAYEAAPAFDRALTTRPPQPPLPLAWFAIFDTPPQAPPLPPPAAPATPTALWQPSTERGSYDQAIQSIRNRIAAGAVYQVNHTLRLTASYTGDARVLYDALVHARHGLYHAFMETAEWAVVSASPELFLEVGAGMKEVATRPMKGTVRRGRWLEEDRAAAAALAASTKDRAENLMIVDLLRNDLGRVARFGTVRVPQLFAVESYPTVHQLTSTVTAELREGVTLGDVLAATFPCGSVTGAPKVTAMRAIAELEDSPRGAYCGAVGVVRPDGSATFSVAIRTVTVDRATGSAVYGTGGGITWDSQADAEHAELVAKAALLTDAVPPFRLLETMRMEQGVVPRLSRHLQRLRDSAAYWGWDGDVVAAAARRELAGLAARQPAGSFRIRLTLGPDADAAMECTPLEERERSLEDADVAPRQDAALARTAVSSRDRLLFHKTTARQVYDSRRDEFPGAFDVLLCNEEGFVTEFTFGNVVASVDGRLVTPPREHGLLAGTLRGELLDRGLVQVAPISLPDIRRATRLYHLNSVRGATRIRLV
jgi:para-aminobenzoate synthetase / 4-amino-4-deoxychorismate lyase